MADDERTGKDKLALVVEFLGPHRQMGLTGATGPAGAAGSQGPQFSYLKGKHLGVPGDSISSLFNNAWQKVVVTRTGNVRFNSVKCCSVGFGSCGVMSS